MIFGIDKKKLAMVFFSLAILLGIFFRVYKFNDWMLFKGDSFRDAILISHPYNNGLADLPLLGPKAGGTMLRTGPAFYYIEYLATLLFHSVDAPVFAYPILLFSLLSIPLSFVFFGKYFSKNWSMVLAGLFSVSYVLIEYSRFAWNPNPAPFFNLLFFYALLEIFDSEKTDKRMRWFVIAAVSFSISTQLHYSNFIGLPIVTLIFTAFNFRRIKTIFDWKKIVAFIAIVVLFYTPMIINDTISRGSNTKQFLKSIQSKPGDESIKQKVITDIEYFSSNFLRILSGYFGSNRILIGASFCFFLLALGAGFALFRKEKNTGKKNFLFLSLVLFLVYFIIYIPLAFSVDKPRFFLPIAMLPFVFLGYVSLFLFQKSEKIWMKFLIGALILIPFAGNVYFLSAWFGELGDSEIKSVNPENAIVLKEKGGKMWWTWSHFKKSADYMEKDCEKKSIYYMMQKGTTEFSQSIEYAMRDFEKLRPVHTVNNSVPYNSNACYYYISIAGSNIPKNLESFQFINEEKIGSMSVRRFNFKNVSEELKLSNDAKEDDTFNPLKDEIENETKKAANSRILSNKARLFWGDVFNYF